VSVQVREWGLVMGLVLAMGLEPVPGLDLAQVLVAADNRLSILLVIRVINR
jgi:hypothetical protein